MKVCLVCPWRKASQCFTDRFRTKTLLPRHILQAWQSQGWAAATWATLAPKQRKLCYWANLLSNTLVRVVYLLFLFILSYLFNKATHTAECTRTPRFASCQPFLLLASSHGKSASSWYSGCLCIWGTHACSASQGIYCALALLLCLKINSILYVTIRVCLAYERLSVSKFSSWAIAHIYKTICRHCLFFCW